MSTPCPMCAGTGTFYENTTGRHSPCSYCNGTGIASHIINLSSEATLLADGRLIELVAGSGLVTDPVKLLAKLQELQVLREQQQAFARLQALLDDGHAYTLYSDVGIGATTHTCEFGRWGTEPNERDFVVSGHGATPQEAINNAIDAWERGELDAPIIPCYQCGKLHHPALPCPGSKHACPTCGEIMECVEIPYGKRGSKYSAWNCPEHGIQTTTTLVWLED